MTKQEAIQLEQECDQLFSDELLVGCSVSMALTGRLKIQISRNYICMDVRDMDDVKVDYIKYTGFYDELCFFIDRVKEVILKNKEKITLLMESYKKEYDD